MVNGPEILKFRRPSQGAMKGGALAHHAPFVQEMEGRSRTEPLRQTSGESVESPAGAKSADDFHALPEADPPSLRGFHHRVGKVHAPNASRHDLAVIDLVRMSHLEGRGKLEARDHRRDGVNTGLARSRKARRMLEVVHPPSPVSLRVKNSYLYNKMRKLVKFSENIPIEMRIF